MAESTKLEHKRSKAPVSSATHTIDPKVIAHVKQIVESRAARKAPTGLPPKVS